MENKSNFKDIKSEKQSFSAIENLNKNYDLSNNENSEPTENKNITENLNKIGIISQNTLENQKQINDSQTGNFTHSNVKNNKKNNENSNKIEEQEKKEDSNNIFSIIKHRIINFNIIQEILEDSKQNNEIEENQLVQDVNSI